MTPEEKQLIVDEFKTIALGELFLESDSATITLSKYIQNLVRSGTDPVIIKARLLADLREGGMIFGSFRSAFKATVYSNIESSKNEGMHIRQDEMGVELYSWVAELDSNTCIDCANRDQMPARTYEEWEIIGLPRSGVTICGDRCRCELVSKGVISKPMNDEATRIYKEEKRK